MPVFFTVKYQFLLWIYCIYLLLSYLWSVLPFYWLSTNKTAVGFQVYVFMRMYVFVSIGHMSKIYIWVKLPGILLKYSTPCRSHKLFSKWPNSFTFFQLYEGSNFSIFLPTLSTVCSLYHSHFTWCCLILPCIFTNS